MGKNSRREYFRAIYYRYRQAGLPEIDLVSHSGTSAAGEFAYSLNQTDILPSHKECNQGKKIRMLIEPVCDA